MFFTQDAQLAGIRTHLKALRTKHHFPADFCQNELLTLVRRSRCLAREYLFCFHEQNPAFLIASDDGICEHFGFSLTDIWSSICRSKNLANEWILLCKSAMTKHIIQIPHHTTRIIHINADALPKRGHRDHGGHGGEEFDLGGGGGDGGGGGYGSNSGSFDNSPEMQPPSPLQISIQNQADSFSRQ
ncbi:hypothetical protein CEXT_641381 [Caerostris extrusa]|uniref:Uncharacterized protein n=1 Tax=Caerostris extrusa TaxID=172846 RepID=A0AAV4QSJ8_CAEEX|nr:hypothetical protein CEXT_641381 [Caerostris extrusa]